MPILRNNGEETALKEEASTLSFSFPVLPLPFLSKLCSDKPRLLGNASEKLTQTTMSSWIQPTRITILENVFRPNLFSHSHSWQNCRKNHSCLKAEYSEVQYYTTASVRGKIKQATNIMLSKMMGQRFILKGENSKLSHCSMIPKAGNKPEIKTSYI